MRQSCEISYPVSATAYLTQSLTFNIPTPQLRPLTPSILPRTKMNYTLAAKDPKQLNLEAISCWVCGSSWVHELMGSLVHDMGSWVHGSWVNRVMGSWVHRFMGSWVFTGS